MKSIFGFFVFFFSIQISLGQQQNRIQVAVLGTFHFGESSDYASISRKDIMSRKSLKEINKLVSDLATFYPNKIFVENTPDTQGLWDGVYADYRKGLEPKNPSILVNEVFQIGIKLAKQINDPFGVICVNYTHPEQNGGLKQAKTGLDTIYTVYSNMLQNRKPEIGRFFQENPLADKEFKSYLKKNDEWSKLSLEKHLLAMNEASSINSLHYLNITAWMDQNPNGIGAELTAKEYLRNAKILQNVLHKLNPYDKRVLIIIGAAHVKPLKDMIEAHPLLEFVPIQQILKD
ncbi:DUF5694 domain-containing protein [Lacihabitans sp. CS3-21]|uniref:DUF5694 domain-containing protein n=1 Tax=Lacihabitans sp. CS3-21 TaxID=2487332 RepID=UPI0020CBAFFF|nr:DUF5694 domain-containing protein [Lacihabitans sp. CS3-21]MCP9747972.1 hypothetical protein [Lacihabitans sp. CS3-21]